MAPAPSATAGLPPPSQEHTAVASKGSIKLEKREVLELENFVEKKSWIDEKIKFLSTLPQVVAVTPEPPAAAVVPKAELEAWWEEHDKIETECDAFDYGDLTLLRKFARDASMKNNLSNEDTDLIEIALATLFAIDQLSHLLRQRRRSLSLLTCRLQWEEQLNAAWKEHQKISDHLPRFLNKARWAPPEIDNDTGSKPATPTSATSDFRNSFYIGTPTLQRTNSSSANSSAMSRTMRAEILALELASSKTKIQSLIATIVPATAVQLDKLIDNSSNPLPESFLLHQEKLEEAAKDLTNGLPAFLSSMFLQWKNADEVFWKGTKIEDEATTLVREVEEALLKLPDSELAAGFSQRRAELLEGLVVISPKALERRKKTEGFLPMPTHPVVEDQERFNSELLETLQNNFESASSRVDSATEVVGRYSFAVSALDRGRLVRGDMEEQTKLLREFVEEISLLENRRPPLDDPLSLTTFPNEQELDEKLEQLFVDISSTLLTTSTLLKDASVVVVDLTEAGIDPNIRQAVRDTMAGLVSAKARAEEVLGTARVSREKRLAAREVAAGIKEGTQSIALIRERLEKEMLAVRWTESCQVHVSRTDFTPILEELRQRIGSRLSAPLQVADSLLRSRHPQIYAHLESQLHPLRANFDQLYTLERLLQNTLSQRLATTSLLEDLERVENELAAIRKEVNSAHSKPREAWGEGEMEEQSEGWNSSKLALEKRLAELVKNIHLRIPFLSQERTPPLPQSPPYVFETVPLLSSLSTESTPSELPRPSYPFDVAAQDTAIRWAVNSASATTSGVLEDLVSRLAAFDFQRKAFDWDREVEPIEAALRGHGDRVAELHREFEVTVDPSQESLARFLELSTAHQASSDDLQSKIDALDTSLSSLFSSLAPSPQVNSDDKRRSQLQTLRDHATTSSTTLSLLAKRIQVAEHERIAQLEREAALVKLEEERRIAWETKRDNILDRLQASVDSIALVHQELQRIPSSIPIPDLPHEESNYQGLLVRHQQAVTIVDSIRVDIEMLAANVPLSVSESQAIPLEVMGEIDADVAAEAQDLAGYRKLLDDARLEAKGLEDESARRLQVERRAQLVTLGTQLDHYAELQEQCHSNLCAVSTPDPAISSLHPALDSTLFSTWNTLASQLDRLLFDSTLEDVQDALDSMLSSVEPGVSIMDPESTKLFQSVQSRVTDLSSATTSLQSSFEAADVKLHPPVKVVVEVEEVDGAHDGIRRSLPHEEVDDVFGPTPQTLPFGDDNEPLALSDIRALLAEVETDRWLDQDSFLPLPTTVISKPLEEKLAEVKQRILQLSPDAAASNPWLASTLATKTRAVRMVSSLASFYEAVVVADATLSDLLSSIDAITPDHPLPNDSDQDLAHPILPVIDSLHAANSAVATVMEHSASTLEDHRVEVHVGRIDETLRDLKAMLEDIERSTRYQVGGSGRSSSRSSRIPTPSVGSTRPPSEGSVSGSTRLVASDFQKTPVRRRQSNPRPPSSTTSRRSSIGFGAPVTPRTRIPSSATKPQPFSFGTVSRATSRSVSGSSDLTEELTGPNLRASHGRKSGFGASPSKPRYSANPNRVVDMLVATAVNSFPVPIPVKAAVTSGQDEQNDSGRYWIGDRVYFCRVLRSSRVMVRVGGGWQNITSFLMKHFEGNVHDLEDTTARHNLSLSRSYSGGSLRRSVPASDSPWISSASVRLSTSTTSHTGAPSALSRSYSGGISDLLTPNAKAIWRP